MKSILVLSALFALVHTVCWAAGEVPLFRDIEGPNVHLLRSNGPALVRRFASLPDEKMDWGEPIAGLQMAIGCTNSTFREGEPVTVFVTIRNVSDVAVSFRESYETGDLTFGWFIITKSRQLIAPRKTGIPIIISSGSNAGGVVLEPHMQKIYEAELHQAYDLPAGEYVVTATRNVGRIDGNGLANIRSGNVVFTITNAPDTRAGNASDTASSRMAKPTNTMKPAPDVFGAAANSIIESGGLPTKNKRVAGPVTDSVRDLLTTRNIVGFCVVAGLLVLIAFVLVRARNRS